MPAAMRAGARGGQLACRVVVGPSGSEGRLPLPIRVYSHGWLRCGPGLGGGPSRGQGWRGLGEVITEQNAVVCAEYAEVGGAESLGRGMFALVLLVLIGVGIMLLHDRLE